MKPNSAGMNPQPLRLRIKRLVIESSSPVSSRQLQTALVAELHELLNDSLNGIGSISSQHLFRISAPESCSQGKDSRTFGRGIARSIVSALPLQPQDSMKPFKPDSR